MLGEHGVQRVGIFKLTDLLVASKALLVHTLTGQQRYLCSSLVGESLVSQHCTGNNAAGTHLERLVERTQTLVGLVCYNLQAVEERTQVCVLQAVVEKTQMQF
ncbi:hypothetical protein LWI29_032064 [Acer saccharum]|uniref:Uncharacterized protein n=1 Tax=Acer saccharum TaxID=4024 RepID=A0AA39RP49_ACESA|nr:hypothetical protein LWI29_032064 [Acer saccharum]